MRILPKEKTLGGMYQSIQNTFEGSLPDTHYEVAGGVELSCGGFGTLTITDGVVTAFTADETAWVTWQAEHQPPTPEPTAEERISALETLVLELGGVI